MKRRLAYSFLILAWTVLGGRQALATPACLACHSAPDMGAARVTADSLSGSVHKGFTCTDCHTGMPAEAVPHPHPAPRVNCMRCHATPGRMGAPVVSPIKHGPPGAPTALLPRCANCHGTHDIRRPQNMESKVSRQNVVQTCAACHGPKGVAAKIIGSRQVVQYRMSVHGRPDPSRPGLYAAVCTDCHGSHSILPANNPESGVYKTRVPQTCGRCHKTEYKLYEQSVHGRAVARGNKDAPACTDCHGEHNILAPSDRASSVSGYHIVETCARCHANKTLIRRYNLPTARVESYKQSFHGVANEFGEIQVANCASCHRAHLILPESNPRSSIYPANLPSTCGRPDCHPGAGPNFARGHMHLTPSPRSDRAVFWVSVGYAVFIWLLISSFVLMIAGDLVQHARHGWKVHEPEPSRPLDTVKVQRFTRNQLLQHATLLISFTLLLLTGMPIRFANSAASGWVIRALGGMTVRGNIHRAAALLLVAVCLWHLVWTVSTRRGRADFIRMLPKVRDIGRAFGMLKFYLGLSMEMPGFGRFNLIEKFEYLAMGWGSVVMIVTGLALWFPDITLRFLPKWGLDICHVVHGYEAVLAFLAIIVWHFYHVHFKPGTFPMSRVWLDGEVTLAEMRHEHRLEYERLTDELSQKHGSAGLVQATPDEVRKVTEEIETTQPDEDVPGSQTDPEQGGELK